MAARPITVDPKGATASVTITGGDVFDDAVGGVAVTFPVEITAVTEWYAREDSAVATRTTQVDVAGVTVFGPKTDTLPQYVEVSATATQQQIGSTGGDGPSGAVEWGRFMATSVLSDYVDGTVAVLAADESSAGLTITDGKVVFAESGIYAIAITHESATNDATVDALGALTGVALTYHAEVPPNAGGYVQGRVSGEWTAPVDLVAHPVTTFGIDWSYSDAEPTVASGGVVVHIARIGDLPTIT